MHASPWRAIVLVLGVGLAANSTFAQQPRQRDKTPFERPKPLATVGSTSNTQTLRDLQAVLVAKGFITASADWLRGDLIAIKKDAPPSDGSDRVLLWLERDPEKPGERASIYFMFGRFEAFFGSTEGPVRVQMYSEEMRRMNDVQDALLTFALAHP